MAPILVYEEGTNKPYAILTIDAAASYLAGFVNKALIRAGEKRQFNTRRIGTTEAGLIMEIEADGWAKSPEKR